MLGIELGPVRLKCALLMPEGIESWGVWHWGSQ